MQSQLKGKTIVNLNAEADDTTKEPRKNSRTIDKCPECGSSNLIHDYDTGETVCSDCGLVLHDQMMDKGPEWRAYTNEERVTRSRVGMPQSYAVHDKGLSTSVGGGPAGIGFDAFGRKLSVETRAEMARLSKWQKRSRVHSSFDRNLVEAMAELDRLCDKVIIPQSIKEKAAIIYRRALVKRVVRGRSIATITAAALYAACRGTKTPRTLNEIGKASLVGKKDVARSYRLLLKEVLDINMPVRDPILWVSKIASMVGISGETQGIAVEIIHRAMEKRINQGKDSISITAAALWIACNQNQEHKNQKDIAEAAGITEVTVRNCFKWLKDKLGLSLSEY